jgi:hypothetical protein
VGVQPAEQRQVLIDELYDYLREFFEVTRQKEEKAIINKNKARRLALIRPAEVAAQILTEIKADHPELLRRYDPDFVNLHRPLDTYDLPAEGQPQELRDLYHDRGVVFLKGKKGIVAINIYRSKTRSSSFSPIQASGAWSPFPTRKTNARTSSRNTAISSAGEKIQFGNSSVTVPMTKICRKKSMQR